MNKSQFDSIIQRMDGLNQILLELNLNMRELVEASKPKTTTTRRRRTKKPPAGV